jgi:hypothetical protein
METKDILDIWEKGNKELLKNDKTSKAMITKYLDKQTLKTTKYYGFNILFFTFVQLVNVILCSMNIIAYSMNPTIMYVLIGALIASTGILIYGAYLYLRLREIKNFSDSLLSLINKQLHFIKVKYEIWMVIISLSVIILTFNLNIMVDYNEGYYPINNKTMYIFVNVFLFVFIWVVQKVSGFRMIAELKAYLSDLKNGVLEQSQKLEKGRKKLKLFLLVVMIFFTLTALAGLLKALSIF